MKLVDSHCHLHMIDYVALKTDMTAVVAAARDAGVCHMLCVATDFSEHETLCQIAETFEQVTLSVGLHPNESTQVKPELAPLLRLASHPKVVAIGETGLDYYRGEEHQALQKEWFITHMAASKQLKKPLIIHTRMAKEDTLALMRQELAGVENSGVLHCFTEDWDMARQAVDLGLFVSFSGIITFKNAESLRDVVKRMPLDRLLIETDAPFLAPVPFRGKINQPAYVRQVAECVAQIKQLPVEEVARQTTANFETLFRQKVPVTAV